MTSSCVTLNVVKVLDQLNRILCIEQHDSDRMRYFFPQPAKRRVCNPASLNTKTMRWGLNFLPDHPGTPVRASLISLVTGARNALTRC